MHLSQEINTLFIRLKRGLVDPEMASHAVEQLISAHVRKPPAQLDASIRSAVARMRHRAADYVAIEAEILAWMSLRAETEDQPVLWL
jgi:hypothetical protein